MEEQTNLLSELQAEVTRLEAITQELTEQKRQIEINNFQLYPLDGPTLDLQKIIRTKRNITRIHKHNLELEKEKKEAKNRLKRNRKFVSKFKEILDQFLATLPESLEISPEYHTASAQIDLKEFWDEKEIENSREFLCSYARFYFQNIVPKVYPGLDRSVLNLSFVE